MKILTTNQIREADRATVEHQKISSTELMERAAEEIARWIAQNVDDSHRLFFCCGKGGNGGDGLAAARMLAQAGRRCAVILAHRPDDLSDDARTNLKRLPRGVEVFDFARQLPEIKNDATIIDALLGVGFTGAVREPVLSAIGWINSLPNRVISIDLPSGMATDWPDGGQSIGECIEAETTLTLQFPKLGLLLPGNGGCGGNVVVLPIGLDETFIAEAATPYYYITAEWVESLRPARAKFSHKGNYGHALVVCGSASMPGAAILALGGALRSGCGLVTAHIPLSERFALTANHPSAMLSLDGAECFSHLPSDMGRFSAIGAGCGLGKDPATVDALEKLLAAASDPAIPRHSSSPKAGSPDAARLPVPMVLDADALSIIAANPRLRPLIPAGSVLTPHRGELLRLVGEWVDDREMLEKSRILAAETRSVVVVKGAHTAICTPDGRLIFNSTGNPGMAKGGSGDVLAGYVTGLLARGHNAETTSIIGVYIHGQAGDRAAEYYGVEAMNSGDLAEFLQ